MKLPKTLISITLLAIILLSVSVTVVLSHEKGLKAKVKWRPKKYVLDDPVPDLWNAEIKLKEGRKTDEINASTILLEGIYPPVSEPYPKDPKKRKKLIVPFDGNDVLTALLLKLGHVTPRRHKIKLEITGKLIDGTPFRGTGHIKLIISS